MQPTIPDILLEKKFRLPINQNNYKNNIHDSPFRFRRILYSLFDEFIEQVDKLNPEEFSSSSNIRELISSLKKAIDFYLEGHPNKAYTELKISFDQNRAFNVLVRGSYAVGNVNQFYRVRKNEKNYAYPKHELFHIPFEKRGKINTQRYSIPGTPCLYLANSVYVAWEELRRPPLDEVQVSKFINTMEIRFLDLVTDVYGGRKNILKQKEDQLANYLVLWPLIASCSVKVLNDEDSFKPEYIIPQLLLQLIRTEKQNEFDAIRFSSTHVSLDEQKESDGEFYNLAIPVKESSKETTKEMGYCKELKAMFKMTDVLSWQLMQATSTEVKRSTTYSNDNVRTIELIKGRAAVYFHTPFCQLESGFVGMPMHDLTQEPGF